MVAVSRRLTAPTHQTRRFRKVPWIGRFRRLADRVIDTAAILKSPTGLQGAAVILHGASCSGKSTILRRLKRSYTGCTFLEMDDLKYWRVAPDADVLNAASNLLIEAGIETDKSKALVHSIEHSDREPQKNSRHGTMVELVKACIWHDPVIATCGNLPPPNVDKGFYRLLEQSTKKTVLHVLVAPDNTVLAKRIHARRLDAQAERFIASNNRWLQNRSFYDLVLTGDEPPAEALETIRTSISKKKRITAVDGLSTQSAEASRKQT